jgi:uncharacterized membrane protein
MSGMASRQTMVWSFWTLLCVGVALFSYRYIVGIGPFPEEITSNGFATPWLVLHAATASTAQLLGPFQFIGSLRSRRPAIHRLIGRIYVSACLLGGLTALPLVFGPTSGPISSLGFGGLALLWLWTTLTAWRHATQRNFVAHRQWMVRSFALTCSAVTLRLYLGVLMLLPVEFEIGYRAISFLCWVPNILVAEWLIRRPSHRLALAQPAR